jgi:hypothetical protein
VSPKQTIGTGTYLERRSALTPLLVLSTVVGPVAVLAILVIVSIVTKYNGVPAALTGVAVVAVLVGSALAYRSWPTGIKIDQSGITIGAVTTPEQDLKWRKPTVYHQASGVYSCPWQSVHNARIVTDKNELREIAKSPTYYTLTNRWGAKPNMTHCNIGVLTAPLMRAALVVDVHPSGVTATEVRPGRAYSLSRAHIPRIIRPELSPTWVVPTRHAGALGQMLERYEEHFGGERAV